MIGKKNTSLSQLMMFDDHSIKLEAPSPETIAHLPYSSGTTGLPKGVMLTHRNLVANIVQVTHPAVGFFEPDDTVVVVNPLYHVYGMNTTTLNLLAMGGTAITLPKFEPKMFVDALENFKVSIRNPF